MFMVPEVSFSDLDFDKMFTEEKTKNGWLAWRWVSVGMPRITRSMSACVFYLFGINPKTGKMTTQPGATGFFVAESSRTLYGMHHVYAVSNRHAINPYSCIRIITKSGDVRIIDYDPSEWTCSDQDDLAIIDVTDQLAVDPDTLIWKDDISWINELDVLGHEDGSGRAYIGDQTIMMGLFADHLGAANVNAPVARFGNLSAFARDDVPVSLYPGDIFARPAFLNDMRSRTGFSGSPVWAWYSPYGDVDVSRFGGIFLDAPRKRTTLCLIGVHRGQFREDATVIDTQSAATTLKIASSMTVVVPAWEIKKLLKNPKIQLQKDARDERLDRKKRSAKMREVFQTQEIRPIEDGPF